MASVLDQYLSVGKETTYATAVAPTRAYEASEDTFQRESEQITNSGFRAGKHAGLDSRRSAIDLGATGSIAGAATLSGMGLLLEGLLGSATITQAGSSAAYTQTFETTTAGPDESYTIQMARATSGGVLQAFNYSGATATGFNFAANSEAELSYRIDYSAASEDTTSSPTAPAYPAGNEMFIYSDVTLAINGTTTTAITSFSLDGDLAMNTSRRFLRGDARRAQPIRQGEASFSGNISAEFANLDLYNLYKNDTTFALTITAATTTAIATDGGTTYFPTLSLEMPACRLDGSSPTASTSENTTLDSPFVALWNESDPALTITYITADTTY